MASGTVVSLIGTAVFVGTLGILIKYFGMVRLIAGYDPDRVADEEGLADFVGTNTLYVAVLISVVALVEYTGLFDGSDAIWIVFVVGVSGLAARLILGARRYEEPASTRR
ncbi:DUF3784 domain-containing protein [Natrinema salsiterrestre]|uniref:DUF3784 domain-containing protein n=1 Tax=Natrinema salsiterrestre TaxID=2950540 RepID=A0A9Q4L4K2_9EURY|nr:DUF3784 domain-containing protein [Natrinema salsiterrestre]MDF9745820.1 DUF3784 domain-containing protein [Natrinema salsiterrestre]